MILGKKNWEIRPYGEHCYVFLPTKTGSVGGYYLLPNEKLGRLMKFDTGCREFGTGPKFIEKILFKNEKWARVFIDKCLAAKKQPAKSKTNKVELNNNTPTIKSYKFATWYPRLQVNKRGEIVLATDRHTNGLTTGILVGKTKESKSTAPIGQFVVDWEVCGDLVDYDGEVTVTISNRIKNEKQY